MAKGKAGGSADHAAVTREQNRLRGIIGSISDRRATEIEPTKAFREHIRLSLLESRRRLKPAQLEQLVTWLTLQRVTGVRDTAAAILLGPSSVIGRSKESSVSTELRWLLARLLPEVERLRSFRSMAEDLNRLAWAGDLNGSLQLLDNIDSRFGSTLWSIELRLAFVAMKDGLEAQKQYLRQLREEWGGGMPGFLAFYYSIRNEDRSTIRLFRDDVRKRVDKFRLFPQAKTYLRFRLADEFSGERRDISRILSCEQTQSILDVYETTVEVIQRLIKMGKHKRYASAVVHWAKGLEAVGDFRLSKILFALGEEPNVNLPRRSGSAAGLLAQGEVDRAYQQATSEHHLQPSNVYAAVESLVAAGVEKQTAEPGATLWRSLYPTLSSILLADGDFEVSVGSIEKFTRNFRGLHSAVALADVAAFLAGGAERFESALGAGALNSEWVGPEDVLLASGSSAQQLELGFGFSDYAAARGASRNSQIAVLASSFVSYFEALRTATTTPRRAFESLRKVALGFIPTALRRLILITRIDLALSENERNLAIEDIADLAALHPASRTILPVERVLANRSWHDLASSGPRLDLAVALDVVWQKTGDDQFGSFLRFAFEDVLAERQVTHPHQLLNGESQPDHKLIYFLRYIASPQVMDLTGLFATSRSVLEERIAVCESLSAADPINQKAYDEEAYTLKSQLLV
jgi:hypothetical protein